MDSGVGYRTVIPEFQNCLVSRSGRSGENAQTKAPKRKRPRKKPPAQCMLERVASYFHDVQPLAVSMLPTFERVSTRSFPAPSTKRTSSRRV